MQLVMAVTIRFVANLQDFFLKSIDTARFQISL